MSELSGLQLYRFPGGGASATAKLLYLMQANLRYRALVGQRWETHYDDDLEIERDAYDTAAATYLLITRHDSPVVCLRMLPTTRDETIDGRRVTFLTRDLCERLGIGLRGGPLACGANRLDAGRLCKDPTQLGRDLSRRLVKTILVAALKHCVEQGVDGLYGLMPVALCENTWLELGHAPDELSDAVPVDRVDCRVIMKRPSPQAVARAIASQGTEYIDLPIRDVL